MLHRPTSLLIRALPEYGFNVSELGGEQVFLKVTVLSLPTRLIRLWRS